MINSYVIFGANGEFEKSENDNFRLTREPLGRFQRYIYRCSANVKLFYIIATCITLVVPFKDDPLLCIFVLKDL